MNKYGKIQISKLLQARGSSRIVTTLSNLILVDPFWGGKLVIQMAYFYPHGKRHGRVSPGVPYICQSGPNTAKAHGRVASRVAQVRLDHGQGTRACLVAV
ncbi:Putative pumilio -like protein [Gossypium arboreum]|uniref:Putative pumilio-like protein n=1 Tax=Gossypium arboreum TaxID=29729 RepID=A0A0B0PH25_GOSAR|nr:Putative pumilio -like protein [Gossypium arboreum]